MRLPTNTDGWAGATAFVVALFLSAGWSASMFAAAVNPEGVSESGVQLLTGLGGVLAGAVAGYLGAGAALIWKKHHDEKEN